MTKMQPGCNQGTTKVQPGCDLKLLSSGFASEPENRRGKENMKGFTADSKNNIPSTVSETCQVTFHQYLALSKITLQII